MAVWTVPDASKKNAVSFSTVVENIGKTRDAVLVLASLAYVLGYVSWACYASRHGLGLIPAFDTQYLLAGVAPSIALAVIVVGGWGLLRLRRWLEKPLTPRALIIAKVLSVVLFVVVVAGFALQRSPAWKPVGGVLITVGVIVGVAMMFLERGRRSARVIQSANLVSLWIYLVIFGILLPTQYFRGWFEFLPQEWGGPGARLVAFDVEGEKLSPPMRALLLGSSDAAAEGVVRGKPVRLVFEGSDFVYFFPRSAADISPETKKVSPKDVYRLRRDLVVSVVPVEPPH